MRAFARRLSETFRPQRVRFNSRVSQTSTGHSTHSDTPKADAILVRPSVASIYQFDDDREYFKRLDIERQASKRPVGSVDDIINNQPTTTTSSLSSISLSSGTEPKNFEKTLHPKVLQPSISILKNSSENDDSHERENREMFARTMRFLSILYAFCLIVIGALCTWPTISEKNNIWRECFLIIICLVGFVWLLFLHYDILKYKRWAIDLVHPNTVETNSAENDSIGSLTDAYDTVSLNTAVIFDRVPHSKYKSDRSKMADLDTISIISTHLSRKGEYGYRYFQGKHSNDFYLKIGVIVFCFGSIMHLGVGSIQEFYFVIKSDSDCQNFSRLLSDIFRVIFSIYQLFIMFKYSNIIINRHKNVARFALMHLLGASIGMWIDSIVDEVIDEFVHSESHSNGTETSSFITKHLEHDEKCSLNGLVSNKSITALPYLYPFTIEFNIAMASIWYMIWTNIGKVNDRSLFHPIAREIVEDEHGHEDVEYRSSGLSIQVDCHASSRGLFLGLASLLGIIITIVVFFSTLTTNPYFSAIIYTVQCGILTLFGLLVIPLAYYKIQQLNVVSASHRDNAFTIMDDILVLLPLPFYIVHYTLSIIANVNIDNEHYHGDDNYYANAIVLSIVQVLMIIQVLIQSPFIVDGLRRCANTTQSRFNKPGRELVTFALILNVIFWILNTIELKSVEEYHGLHHYFGPIYSKMIAHTTLPLMLFYRFHSSVCLSNIWKYAYEKDHH